MKTSAAPGRAPTPAPNSVTNPAPLVSIITPCRNAEAFIGAAIDSVRAQTLTDWEMLIVDDASTDASAAVIKDYAARDNRIHLLSRPCVAAPGRQPSAAPSTPRPTGAAAARNHAIAQARGRYIAFLDADDVWFADKLAKQTAFMATHEQAFTYASYRLIDAADRDLGVFTVPPQITRADLLKVNSVSCLAAVYDARALGKMRMPALDIGHDYALWLAILKRVGSARGIVEPLAAYRIQQPASLSGDKLRAARRRWHIYRRHERLSRAASAYYFCHYAYHGLLKYLWRARITRWLNHLRTAIPQTWRRK